MQLTKPFLVLAAAAAAVTATLRRRQARSDVEAVWRDATSDASH